MYQYDDPTVSATLPTPAAAGTAGYFTDGNPVGGIAATELRSDFMNMVMMELLNVVTAAGLTPSKTTYNQVATAIKTLVSPGRLLRASYYYLSGSTQMVSVNGAAGTSSGATSFTALAGTNMVEIEAQGAGSGAPGTPSNGSSTVATAVGGSGGAWGRGIYTSGFASLTITVGKGGAGGTAGLTSGSAGGSSSAGSLISCPGGPAIAATPAGGAPLIAGGGQASAAPTGANLDGNPGGPGFWGYVPTQGGTGVGGTGGSSGKGVPGPTGGTNAGGASAPGLGAGGAGGSQSAASGGAVAGGGGNSGWVLIKEYA